MFRKQFNLIQGASTIQLQVPLATWNFKIWGCGFSLWYATNKTRVSEASALGINTCHLYISRHDHVIFSANA